jgi:glucosylglycerol-phosphate synthase
VSTRSSFAVVYHRPPCDDGAVGDAMSGVTQGSPNGIIPTLRAIFTDGTTGVWIARAPTRGGRPEAAYATAHATHAGLRLHRVALTTLDVERFYHRFSKEALWPVLCSSPADVRLDERGWEHFVDVNARFADAVADVVQPHANVWVHDYNLWLVPGMLRERLPSARIGFFHHTPFPGADVFAILPWRESIVRSLLACDLVGFQLPHYANNFATAAANIVGAAVTRDVSVDGRFATHGTPLSAPRLAAELTTKAGRTRLGAFPVAVDSRRIDAVRASAAHAVRVAEIGREFAGQQVVLSIERLDYVKGPVEKLLSYERLLEERPEYRGAVCFVNVVAPAAAAVSVHRAVNTMVEVIVDRIDGRFSTASWTPVRYLPRSLPFEEVVAWYEAASIAWVSSLRDGLNLVAKEFVAASDGAAKVLILSEFAGAHVELRHALTVNPYSPDSMDAGLRAALEMDDDMRRLRCTAMSRIARSRTPSRWAAEFLAELAPEGELGGHSNAGGHAIQR